MSRSTYVSRLCKHAGVETFDDLWDTFFELDSDIELKEFLRRCHHFCLHCRLLDEHISESDRRREAFMAEQIRAAMAEFKGRVLVVTGGYHSFGHLRTPARQAAAGYDRPEST